MRFKVGDIIKCIDIVSSHGLTLGKTYKVFDFDDFGDPYIYNDDDKGISYLSFRFKTVTREQKLKRILQ